MSGGAVEHEPNRLDSLPLPAHVNIRIRGEWRTAWLIGCDRQLAGWHGLVQYQDEGFPETTTWLSAEDISW